MKPRNTNTRKGIFNGKALTMPLIAIAALLPAASMAQEPRTLDQPFGEVEIGAGYVSEDSFKFGEYTGLEDKGFHFIGNLDLTGRDNENANYWKASGKNLGLRSREAQGEFGRQGNFSIWLGYDEIPKFRTESAQTIYVNPDSTNLMLPAGWVAESNTTDQAAQIHASLRPYEVKHDRKNYEIGASKILFEHWKGSINFQHETKEGNKVIGALLGNSGRYPRTVLVPDPVDYETDTLRAEIEYTDPKLQLMIGYNMSLFNNNNNSLNFQSPFSHGSWDTDPLKTPHPGQLGLPPDNDFHQIVASGGYSFNPCARLQGNLQYSRMTQDQAFLPYTINPDLAATISDHLPRKSLDGEINNTLAHLMFLITPMSNLDLQASYRYEDHDNKTPMDFYNYIVSDAKAQDSDLVDGNWRKNLPISQTKNKLALDAKYTVTPRTKLNVGFDVEESKHTLSEIHRMREYGYRAILSRSFNEMINGRLRFDHSDRRYNDYDGTVPYVLSHTPAHVVDDAPLAFENHPFLRKFFYADRERDKVSALLNVIPHEMIYIQFRGDYHQDHYYNSKMGLTASRMQSYTADVSFTPTDYLTLYGFYTYDNAQHDTAGRTFRGSDSTDPTRDWLNSADDTYNTFGAGFSFKGLRDKLEVGADFIHSDGNGKLDTAVGPAFPSKEITIPVLISRLNQVELFGTYNVYENTFVKLSYWYQKLDHDDWAWDDVLATTMSNVISTQQLAPNYGVHVVGLSVLYRPA